MSNIAKIARRSYYAAGLSPEPICRIHGRAPVTKDAASAVADHIRSGANVFIHGAAATPNALVNAMTTHAESNNLRDIGLYHIHTHGDVPYTRSPPGMFNVNSMFTGANMRQAVQDGTADFTPIFLSEIPRLFRSGKAKLDTSLIMVSPPDRHGYCSLGTSIDVARAAIQASPHIIAQVNENMPRTFGDGLVHVSHLDAMVYEDAPLPELERKQPSAEEEAIGKLIAENLVQDKATLQMGIGAIPDAVLSYLSNHRELGIHSEMFSDGVVELVEQGVVTNAHKPAQKGRITGGFIMGTRDLYDWVDDNPAVVMMDIAYVNNTEIIARNPRMTAINSAIEVDITGQVVSDSIGSKIFSGVGGQVDFIRGAGMCEDGRPIIALPSRTRKGKSRIVDIITPGGGVVTTRAHVHYIVTEFGIAELFGIPLRERARRLINIAHPDDREALDKAAFERFGSAYK